MIYCMIDEQNTYDYDNELETTENVLTALEWIADGACKQVAKLDGCLAYVGYLDKDDVIDMIDKIDFDDCISEIRFMIAQNCTIYELYDLIDSHHYKPPYGSFMSFYAGDLYKEAINRKKVIK